MVLIQYVQGSRFRAGLYPSMLSSLASSLLSRGLVERHLPVHEAFGFSRVRVHRWNVKVLETKRAALGHTSGQLFSSRFPVAYHLLSLRLVSKRLYRIATPYTWETVDTKIIPERISVLQCRKVKSGSSVWAGVFHLWRKFQHFYHTTRGNTTI